MMASLVPTLNYTAFMQFYITTIISDCNYPTSKMCCPIMSVIFGKALYLIPQKIPPKRYGRFSACHTYIRFRDYQTASSLSTACLPMAEQPSLEKGKGG
jgi:hypothetical protein